MAARKVGIVGLGYVGLPLGVAFAEAGHEVVGLDADPRKVEALAKAARATSRTSRPSGSPRSAAAERDRRLRGPEAVRRGDHLRPDAADQLARAGPHLPGRLHDLARPRCSRRASSWCSSRRPTRARPASGCGRSSRSRAWPPATDFHLAFSPERIDPGRTDYTVRTTPKVVGGLTEALHRARGGALREICDRSSPVSGPEPAELTKLLENIFRSVNIALVNELAMLCERLGIDIWEVIDAAVDQAVRLHALRAGPGHGRALPAGRPVLPLLQGARARLLHRVHRAGREDQPEPAAVVRPADRARAERRLEGGRGLAGSCCSGSPTRRASGTSASRRR